MGKDYLIRYIKVLIRHGKELEALDYLINQKGYDMMDAQIYIVNAKEIVANEPHDD
jgi:hypothetical protein